MKKIYPLFIYILLAWAADGSHDRHKDGKYNVSRFRGHDVINFRNDPGKGSHQAYKRSRHQGHNEKGYHQEHKWRMDHQEHHGEWDHHGGSNPHSYSSEGQSSPQHQGDADKTNPKPAEPIPANPHPIPPEYAPTFDRAHPPYTYTYSDGYHFIHTAVSSHKSQLQNSQQLPSTKTVKSSTRPNATKKPSSTSINNKVYSSKSTKKSSSASVIRTGTSSLQSTPISSSSSSVGATSSGSTTNLSSPSSEEPSSMTATSSFSILTTQSSNSSSAIISVSSQGPSETASSSSSISLSTESQSLTFSSSSSSTTASVSLSSSTTISVSSSSSTTISSSSSSSSSAPSCTPSLLLIGVSEDSFNPINTPFSVNITCSEFLVPNTTALSNFAAVDGIDIGSTSITLLGFDLNYVLLSVFTITSNGVPLAVPFRLLFGSINMPVLVLDPTGNPAANVLVTSTATGYSGVTQSCTTDATGLCTLTNLAATTIGLFAVTPDTSFAADGLAATNSQVTLQLTSLHQPETGAGFNVSNGTTAWTGGTIVDQAFKRKVKRDTTLVVSTNGQFDLQTASSAFNVYPFTSTVFIKYKFVTEEVPGGYFGSQYNDYFSVTIRSDTGAYVYYTNSMNSLGLGEFDANGATDWFTLSLSVPPNTKTVSYDIGVSNVADNLLDSEVIVDQVGDQDCTNCGDCSTCPTDPMCQPSCSNPPLQSCAFYLNCAEAMLDCGPSGYPQEFGNKNCNKFVNNLNTFSSSGQDFIWNTMHCLQQAMVPVLQPCTATCDSFTSAAFDSHPGCYVQGGFCGLSCSDVIATVATVGTDIFKGNALTQAGGVAAGCAQNLLTTLSGCGGEVLLLAGTTALGAPEVGIIADALVEWVNSL